MTELGTVGNFALTSGGQIVVEGCTTGEAAPDQFMEAGQVGEAFAEKERQLVKNGITCVSFPVILDSNVLGCQPIIDGKFCLFCIALDLIVAFSDWLNCRLGRCRVQRGMGDEGDQLFAQ